MTQVHTRHVVGAVDDEEQHEGDNIHADQQRHGVEDAADEVLDHGKKITFV